MKKERIKSVLLILLILANLVLADKILVDKKLWPSGYNFFVNTRKHKKNNFSIAGNLSAPGKIIVNTGYQTSQFAYTRSDSYFDTINNASGDILKKAFLSSSKTALVSSDEWYSILSSKSIYLSFPCSYSAQIFSELLGLSSTEISIDEFSDIAISESGNVYINGKSGCYRISASSDAVSPIIQQVAADHSEYESVINYSFDLNFDKDFGDQKTFLSPMIPIYSAPVSAPEQSVINPVQKSDETINTRSIEGILTAFSINPNTARRYTEADGSLVFVENNGILRISPDGILSFKASDTGIKLSVGNAYGTYSTLAGLAEFIDNINNALEIQTDMILTSSLAGNVVREFSFDYISSGFPVKYKDKNAVTASVNDGYITEYTQILRKYTPRSHFEYSPMYIEALDAVIAKYQDAMTTIQITGMFPAYVDDLDRDVISLDWHIDIDNIIAE